MEIIAAFGSLAAGIIGTGALVLSYFAIVWLQTGASKSPGSALSVTRKTRSIMPSTGNSRSSTIVVLFVFAVVLCSMVVFASQNTNRPVTSEAGTQTLHLDQSTDSGSLQLGGRGEMTASDTSGLQQPLYFGDSSRFLRDVTILDGSSVKRNVQFKKIWEIMNTGSVPWRGRSLVLVGASDGAGSLHSPDRIPIPDTEPGHSCQIRVILRAPSKLCSCRAEYKMVDSKGQHVFPNQEPLFVEVNCVE